ncbi:MULTISPECIES: nitrogen fixation negative regulator NifL [unclassified Brenneria]|uniref:nitrogen fixation negative regulator NifL n=1 Tax=unclassified Brenneria TaxID=2634434 RepID=UPI001554CD05|nr:MULTISPECIES: nitrogen fixation negative regulator NifL [unclassified Brenneria]MBJ7220844.1 nitrogen fixation negative regulator NifL [Brenneria sp. L3-3C-1]MEE3642083.1 nitrogen fixation negative regulator NifL [Brenneria sp. L3_3C_1]MEE3649219.1 nitrogen fixation negative regulator NifL [Brenneria sp. HEZEL_4_2_4]NPC99172.1 nitrogen fixation negative regulator NifL [Brenneria sp. hezel4-2-4]
MSSSLILDDVQLITSSLGGRGLHAAVFHTAVEQSSVAISITDPQANIVYANPAFAELSGYTLQTLIGANHNLLSSHQTPESVYQSLWQTITGGNAWSGQLINRRKDSSLYLAEITISPIVNAQGEIEHYLGMHKDISERYALAQRVRNQMTLISAVLNNIPAAVVVVDSQQKIVMDNLAYKTLSADCAGQEPLALLDGLNRCAPAPLLPLTIRGAQRWFSVSCWPLHAVNEEASLYFTDSAPPRQLVVIVDCTEQQRQMTQDRRTHLERQISVNKMMAAIRETLDAALIQLSCPLNMLSAALRLNPDADNVALRAAWNEGKEALARLTACRPSMDHELADSWPVAGMLMDLAELYQYRLNKVGKLVWSCSSEDLTLRGQRTLILTALSLWLDRCLTLSGKDEAVIEIQARQQCRHLCFSVYDNLSPSALRAPHPMVEILATGQCMELRLIQMIMSQLHGTVSIETLSSGSTRMTLALPLDGLSLTDTDALGG